MIECIEIDRWHPRSDLVHRVSRELNEGRLVACPTDTTYGVFARMDHRDAAARLKRLRLSMAGDQESMASVREKPMAVLFADLQMLSEYVVMTGTAFTLVKQLLPGPYTIILPTSRAVPKQLQSKRRHLGARIPDDPLVQSLLEAVGAPVLSTTLKDRSGQLLGDAIGISDTWKNEIDFVIEGGYFVPEMSTVLAVEQGGVSLIRQGKGEVDLV
jgi:tRNA threonylcarbamoyl adenosine modification protein (Sua5/YciO/YrdC/YwlC family)